MVNNGKKTNGNTMGDFSHWLAICGFGSESRNTQEIYPVY